MGIRIGNRCCGRNYFIDSITGVIPSTDSCKTLYRYNIESEFGSAQPSYFLITPDSVSHTIQYPSDVITVQQSGYELLSRTSNINSSFISNIYFYGTPDQIANWQILNPNTLNYQQLLWQEIGTACSTEKCYVYEFEIDETTYPSASIYDINNETADPFNTPLTVAVYLFSNPSFNIELAELIQSMFGGNVSVTSNYDGSLYSITINYVQSISTTPTFPEFLNLLIDLEPGTGNFLYFEGIETTCP